MTTIGGEVVSEDKKKELNDPKNLFVVLDDTIVMLMLRCMGKRG